MEKFVEEDKRIGKLVKSGKAEVLVCPTDRNSPKDSASKAKTHTGFSTDKATQLATINGIVGKTIATALPIPAPAIQAHEAQVAKE
jgi:hypothetical protein